MEHVIVCCAARRQRSSLASLASVIGPYCWSSYTTRRRVGWVNSAPAGLATWVVSVLSLATCEKRRRVWRVCVVTDCVSFVTSLSSVVGRAMYARAAAAVRISQISVRRHDGRPQFRRRFKPHRLALAAVSCRNGSATRV